MTYTAHYASDVAALLPTGITLSAQGASPFAAIVALLRASSSRKLPSVEVWIYIECADGVRWGEAKIHSASPLRFDMIKIAHPADDDLFRCELEGNHPTYGKTPHDAVVAMTKQYRIRMQDEGEVCATILRLGEDDPVGHASMRCTGQHGVAFNLTMYEQIVASTPEPSPKPEGQEVTPQLLAWLGEYGSEVSAQLVQARAAFGLAKYGQGLRTGDGRNTFNDLSDELGDAQQYAFKGLLNGELTPAQIHTLKTYIRDLTAILDGITPKDEL